MSAKRYSRTTVPDELTPDMLAVLGGGWSAPRPAEDYAEPDFSVFTYTDEQLFAVYQRHRAEVDAASGPGGPWIVARKAELIARGWWRA